VSAPTGIKDRTSGTYLLVIGGAVVVVGIVVLGVLTASAPSIAWPALVVDVLLLAGMVVARFAVRTVVRRQWTLTVCVLAAAVVTLAALWAITATG
jgi:hypothetical protein